MVPTSAALASPGNLLERQILKSFPRPVGTALLVIWRTSSSEKDLLGRREPPVQRLRKSKANVAASRQDKEDSSRDEGKITEGIVACVRSVVLLWNGSCARL